MKFFTFTYTEPELCDFIVYKSRSQLKWSNYTFVRTFIIVSFVITALER